MENPFTPKFGYVPPLLAGRDSVLNRIAAGRANNAHPDSALLLTGRRGTGKTVLLHVALDEAQEQQWVALFASGAEIGLCDKLALQCIDSLDDQGRPIIGVGAQVLGFGASISRSAPSQDPMTALRFVLAKAAQAAAERGSGVLIAVDELQDAPIAAVRELAVAVQYVGSGLRLPVTFLGAGLPEFMAALLADAGLTFFHRCARAETGLLSPSDARLALDEPIKAAGGHIGEPALEQAVQATSGHPYMVQLVGHYAWDTCEDPAQGIAVADVAQAEAASNREMLAQVLLPAWSRLGDSERGVLSAMVAPGRVSPGELARRAGIDIDAAEAALGRVVEAGLAAAGHDGTVGIAHEAMRTWLRAGGGLRPPAVVSASSDTPHRYDRRFSEPDSALAPAGPPLKARSAAASSANGRRALIVAALVGDRRASYSSIAADHGVSRQYVSRIATEEGLRRDARRSRRISSDG